MHGLYFFLLQDTGDSFQTYIGYDKKGVTDMYKSSVPVRIAAAVYGKDPAWVRAGIIFGWLPIGVATCNGEQVTSYDVKGRINYYISPKLLYEHTGYIWKEVNNEY